MDIFENETIPKSGREKALAIVDMLAALLVIGEDDYIAAAYMTNHSEQDVKACINNKSTQNAYFYADHLLDRMAYYSQMRRGYTDKFGYRVTKKTDSYDDFDIRQTEEIGLRNRLAERAKSACLSAKRP